MPMWLVKPDIEKLKSQHDVPSLIEVLRNSNDDVRKAATVALGQLADASTVEPLISALRDKEWNVQNGAAEAFSKIIDPGAIERIIIALEDHHVWVRRSASVALGRIIAQQEDASLHARAINLLIPMLKDNDDTLRMDTINALAQIGNVREKKLINALNKVRSYDKESYIRKSAENALAKIGWRSDVEESEDEREMKPLIAAFRDDDSKVRQSAIESLVKIGIPAVKPLIVLMKDGNEFVRKTAETTLAKIDWKPGQDETSISYWIAKHEWGKCIEFGAAAVIPLVAALRETDKVIRGKAAETLGKLKDPRAVEPLITLAIKDSDEFSSGWAFWALGELKDPRAVKPLIAELKDKEWTKRDRVIKVLGKLNDPRTIEPLIKALKDDNEFVRMSAASALEMIWKPVQDENSAVYWIINEKWEKCIEIGAPAVKPLIAALKDSEKETCISIIETLGNINDPNSIEPLISLLQSGKWEIRKVVAEVLGKFKDPRVVTALISALNDKNQETCRNAAIALGNLRDSSAVNPLTAALNGDYGMGDRLGVRGAIAEALEKIGAAK